MLRLVMDWFSDHSVPDHPLNFSAGAKWYSEALLPSPFKPLFQGDPLGQGRTHVDGVIGHIQIGVKDKAGLLLRKEATQFVVLEAKLMSKLAAGVKHSSTFDQAARNVAGMSEVLLRANRKPSKMTAIGFYVVAPESQIRQAAFTSPMSPESILARVAKQVAHHEGAKDEWHRDWFLALIATIKIELISWEDIFATVRQVEPSAAQDLEAFYSLSMKFAGKWTSPPLASPDS
jgi:hypothetical protein